MPNFTPDLDQTLNFDLNKVLIKNNISTFLFRFQGESEEFKLKENDILVVDRGLFPQNNNLVLDISSGNFKVKKFNKSIKQIWGVITFIIHQV